MFAHSEELEAIRRRDEGVKIIMGLRYFIRENQYFVETLENTTAQTLPRKYMLIPLLLFNGLNYSRRFI